MCRIIVSLLYIKVLISSHYATKRYRKLKLSFFTAFPHLLTPVSVLIYMTPIWFRNCSIPAISARILILKKVITCTHMYLINCKFFFLHMHVELEQLHICHAYIKQARIEEFSSGGGGPTFRKNFEKPPPP